MSHAHPSVGQVKKYWNSPSILGVNGAVQHNEGVIEPASVSGQGEWIDLPCLEHFQRKTFEYQLKGNWCDWR